MRPPHFLSTALATALLTVVAACGTAAPEETEPLDPDEPDAEAAQEETPEPETEEENETEDEADGMDPDIAALEGAWSGPQNDDGSDPVLTFQPNGVATLESSGFTCNGDVEPVEDRTYVLTMSDCVVPLPSVQLELAEDEQSFVDDDGSEWFPEDDA